MPIQVLPRQPSPLEILAPHIMGAVGDITQGIQQRRENQNDARVIQTMFDQDLSPMERIQQSLKLSPKRREAFYSALRASSAGEKFGFQQEREKRLAHADVLAGYDKRLSQINADLKEAGSGEERKRLRSLKDNLVKEQAINRARLRGGKQPQFRYLELEDQQPEEPSTRPLEVPPFESIRENPEDMPSKAASQQPYPEIRSTVQRKKIKWDPRNPDHTARRDMILKQSNGDRARANQIMAQEFDK